MSVADFHASKHGSMSVAVLGWVDRHGFAAALAFSLTIWAAIAGLAFVAAKSFF